LNKTVVSNEEYQKLKEEHQLLAILRAQGIEQMEIWNTAMKILEEGKKNGFR